MKKTVNLERVEDVFYLLRRPLDEITFLPPEKMIELMDSSEKKITVHLYHSAIPRGKHLDIFNVRKWPYHQIYLALQENNLAALICDGETSAGRENHNHCLELLLANKKLRQDLPTTVMLTHKRELRAYYFHPAFAYVDHDIGSNWEQGIRKKLQSARLPYSRYVREDMEKKVSFFEPKEEQKERTIYLAREEDIRGRKFRDNFR